MDIFWSTVQQSTGLYTSGRDMLKFEPVSLFDELKERYKGTEVENQYLKCPSAVIELKKTYVIKSDIDYNIYFGENNSIYSDLYDQDFFNSSIKVWSLEDTMFGYDFYYMFYSEKSVAITMLPAFMHDSPFKDAYFTPGSFDISKWFRPLTTGMIHPKRTDIKIKRGDALFYVRFSTDNKIKLRKFDMSPKLSFFSKEALNLKSHLPNRNLKYLYNIFNQSKYNKKIIKEIKQNLSE